MNDPSLERSGPLAGVKIIDMTSVLLGPFATMMLADLGADVIKVESLRNAGKGTPPGDTWRYAGKTPVDGLGPAFMAANRNKRGVTLDLSRVEDKAALDALLRDADVFIHNVRMAGMRRLECDYDAVKAMNPGIVYVHCAGFGEDGPYGTLSAYDDLIQAASGFADLARIRDGGAPEYAPSAIADKTAGLFAANAVLAALFHRQKTGEGQYVQVPMLETFTFFNLMEHLYGQTWRAVDGPMGYTRAINTNRRPYETLDGHVSILPYSDAQWRTILEVGGFPGVFDSPKFATFAARVENTGELYQYVRQAAVTKTTAEWLEILHEADIPAMQVNALEDVIHDPHLNDVGFFQSLVHPEGGEYRAMSHPVKYSRTPAEIYRHAPRFGEHNDEILGPLRKVGGGAV